MLQFVCMGGTAFRMENFANFIMKEIDFKLQTGQTLLDITKNAHRYSMYKVGPVLSISVSMLLQCKIKKYYRLSSHITFALFCGDVISLLYICDD